MGDNCNTSARGTYFLTVNSKSPFARNGQK